jgi:hypothetical protein
MPTGASPKREREYEKLKERFKKEGRYKGREEEVASRIVNKQREIYGETKGEKQEEKRGRAPDRGLPIENYRHLTIDQIKKRLGKLSGPDVKKIASYERNHKNRKTLLREIDKRAA